MRPAVDAVSDQQPPVWIGRGLVFALVGVVTAGLIDRIVADRERELELAEQERDFAVRQAAVIATVSHEFRTPLTVITGVARTLEVHGMVSGEGESLLTGLMDAARRLTDLVNTDRRGDGRLAGPEVRPAGGDRHARRDGPRPRSSGCARSAEPRVGRDRPQRRDLHLGSRTAQAAVATRDRERGEVLARPISTSRSACIASDGRLEVRVADRGPGIDETLLRSPLPFTQGDSSMTRTRRGSGSACSPPSRLAAVLDGTIRFEPRAGGGTEAIVEVAAPDASHLSNDHAPAPRSPEALGRVRRLG